MNPVSPFALADASDVDRKKQRTGELIGPLHCVPVLPNDNIDVAGLPTAAGLVALNTSVPNVHADVIQTLQAAGAVVIGKANTAPLDMAARFTSSENGGVVKNPFSHARATYGASGGAAAAVAAAFTVIGLGTNGDHGSLSLSAASTGVIGLNPGLRAISNNGVFPSDAILGTVGPMVRWANELALVMDVLRPPETKNFSSLNNLDMDLMGMTVGIVKQLAASKFSIMHANGQKMLYEPTPFVKRSVLHVERGLQKLQANITDVNLPIRLALSSLRNIKILSEKLQVCLPEWINDYLASRIRFPPSRPFHSFVKLMRSSALPNYIKLKFETAYKSGHHCRIAAINFTNAQEDFVHNLVDPLFDDGVDVLAFPTFDAIPPEMINIGQEHFSGAAFASLAGYPTLSLSVSYSNPRQLEKQGMPIGFIFMVQPNDMKLLYKIASAYQKKLGMVILPWTVSNSQSISLWNSLFVLIVINFINWLPGI